MIQTSRFDPHEYAGFINTMTQAEKIQEACKQTPRDQLFIAGSRLEANVHNLENYATHRPNNESTTKIIKIIRETISEFVERYHREPPSVIYCQMKMQSVIDQSVVGAEFVQQKVR